MHMTTKALILREVDYKESDKILTVLAQEGGKMTVSARGCRKKGSAIAAGCQLLAWSELVLYEYQGRWQVREASPEREFRGVRADLDKLALGCYFAELTELLALEDIPSPALLSLTLNCLHALDKLNLPPAQVKGAFEWRAMCLAGYEPLLDGCAVCGAEQPVEARFHLREGVLHCEGCQAEVGEGISLPVSGECLSALRHVAYGDPKRLLSFSLTAQGLAQMAGVTEAYLLTQMERGFRTLDFYKEMTLSAP